MTNEERDEIIEQARKVRDSEDVAFIRSVVCEFYRKGGSPEVDDPTVCNGCKTDECVLNCKTAYLSKIFYRPQKVWTPEFDVPVRRDRVRLEQDLDIKIATYCDACYIKGKCPVYKRGHQCGIEWGEDVSNLSSSEVMDRLINLQQERINRARAFEALDGGVPDATLSTEIDRMSGLLVAKSNLNTLKFNLSASMQAPAENKGGGLLSSLLSGVMGGGNALPQKTETAKEIKQVEDINYEEANEEKATVNRPKKSK